MSRELDWRIHELMGNDLTGFKWVYNTSGEISRTARKHIGGGIYRREYIPYYSTTGDGMLKVLEFAASKDWELVYEVTWIDHANKSIGYEGRFYGADTDEIHNTNSLPELTALAFVAAMDGGERNAKLAKSIGSLEKEWSELQVSIKKLTAELESVQREREAYINETR